MDSATLYYTSYKLSKMVRFLWPTRYIRCIFFKKSYIDLMGYSKRLLNEKIATYIKDMPILDLKFTNKWFCFLKYQSALHFTNICIDQAYRHYSKLDRMLCRMSTLQPSFKYCRITLLEERDSISWIVIKSDQIG